MKCQQNNPPKRYSVFASWYDVTRSELNKFLAVLINIGIQNKPSIKNYWSTAYEDPNSGQAIRIFSTLLKSLDCGHHIFADRYYTTKPLIDKLTADKYLFTGTLNLNRRGFPPQLKQQRLAHLESRYYMSSDDKTLCVAYKGKKAKKEVVLVSTDADISSAPTKKADIRNIGKYCCRASDTSEITETCNRSAISKNE
ncbi:hypothetical protein RRG08_001711 [Elysia crispata]|uniref:PiggyBac transposable element-derived protein domain-containing protein n=1 Tax=Elysia crispata TaxID=231223 RepID=A0AAE1AKI4_9GAST|nr:hypothetical protein RRG08_001711 [Elysia crispata]